MFDFLKERGVQPEKREVVFKCQRCGKQIEAGTYTAQEAEHFLSAQAQGTLLCAECRGSAENTPEKNIVA